MNVIDWAAFGWGMLTGVVAGALFFAGLAFGLRLALRRSRPMPLLALSALLRIAVLLAVGWLVALAGGAAALAGFALAFLMTRHGVIALAKPATQRSDKKCK